MNPETDTPLTSSATLALDTVAPRPLPRRDPVVPRPVDAALLQRLLMLARRYRDEGQVHLAMNLYWELVDCHPGSDAATQARALLLEMAACEEDEGNVHLARSLYERLLNAPE